jgi:hypothetical protein
MFVSLCAVERVSLRTTAPVYRALPNLETTARPQERNELLHCLDGKWIVVGWLTVPRTVADVTSDPAVVRIACTELDYDRRAGAQIQQVAVIQQVAAQQGRRFARASAFTYPTTFFRHRRVLVLIETGIGFGSARIQLGLQTVGQLDAIERV